MARLPSAFAPASANDPSSTNRKVSNVRVENVVYAPTNPTVVAVLNHGTTTTRPSMKTAKRKPMASDPLTLTTNVPQGNGPSFLDVMSPSNPYRATAPKKPATPTAIIVRIRASYSITRRSHQPRSAVEGEPQHPREFNHSGHDLNFVLGRGFESCPPHRVGDRTYGRTMQVLEMDGPGGGWRVLVPETRRERMRGLRGHPPPGPREAMLFLECRSVHTFGMKRPISVVFLDRGMRVLAVRRCGPGRLVLSRRRARHVLETGVRSELRIGDRFSPDRAGR
jgi:uncharacterized protein